VYGGVVDYLLSMQISTLVMANIDVFGLSCDNSRGEKGESILIVGVD